MVMIVCISEGYIDPDETKQDDDDDSKVSPNIFEDSICSYSFKMGILYNDYTICKSM